MVGSRSVHETRRPYREERAGPSPSLDHGRGCRSWWRVLHLARPADHPRRSEEEPAVHPAATRASPGPTPASPEIPRGESGERTRTTRTSSAISRGESEEHAGPDRAISE